MFRNTKAKSIAAQGALAASLSPDFPPFKASVGSGSQATKRLRGWWNCGSCGRLRSARYKANPSCCGVAA